MDEITIGGLPAGENPNDADLFEVEQGGQSVRLTFEQLKVAIREGRLENIEGLFAAGDNVEITGSGTAEDPYNISATGGGGGGIPDAPDDGNLYGRKDGGWEEVPEAEGFDISGLPVAATLQNSDYLPVSQSAAPSVRFWRLTVLSNTENDAYATRNRLYEMQLREIVGVPQTAEPATVTGTGWYSGNPAANAVDGSTSTYAGGSLPNHPPYTVMFEYPEPVAILELAIFYPSSSSGRRDSPGNFLLEYSEDGTIWNTALEVSGYSGPPVGWNTWGLFGDPVQRRAPLQQLREFMGLEAATPQQIRDGAEPLFVATDALRDSKHFREVAAGSADTTLPLDEHINIDLIVSTDTTVDTVGQPAQAGKGVNVLLRGDSPTVHTVTWGSNVLNVDPPVIDNLTDTLGWIVTGIVSPDGRFMITSANEVNL